jgi:hypothetical protein
MSSLKDEVIEVLKRGQCARNIGEGNLFGSVTEAVEGIVPRMDPERCRSCELRLFRACELMPNKASKP